MVRWKNNQTPKRGYDLIPFSGESHVLSLFGGNMKKNEKYDHVHGYRVCLIRDKEIAFSGKPISTAAAELILNTIRAMGQSDRENFVIIMLTAKNQIAGTNIVSQGTVTQASLSMREVFKPAIIANATAVVLGHNHPSGDCDPSPEDISFTRSLKKVGKLLNIIVFDHVIVNDLGGYYSFADNDLMSE
jgi:DNA repair protein RadC